MPKLVTFTIEDIRSWEPCYDPGEFLPEGWQGTALDVLRVKDCPAQDRLWVICRDERHMGIPDETWRTWARWCALQVIGLWDAPEIVRRYLETGDETIRAAARAAAWAAARDAARDAAWDAAWAAAWAAARDAARDAAWAAARDAARDAAWAAAWAAARDAAWAAAWDAARDAAWDAAWDAARDAQIEKLIALIAEEIPQPEVA